jgi:hypothetical protein
MAIFSTLVTAWVTFTIPIPILLHLFSVSNNKLKQKFGLQKF